MLKKETITKKNIILIFSPRGPVRLGQNIVKKLKCSLNFAEIIFPGYQGMLKKEKIMRKIHDNIFGQWAREIGPKHGKKN